MLIRPFLVALALGALAIPAGAAESVRVAVLPVVVNSDGPEDYLRDGLADMLASRLGQQAGLDVVRVEDPGVATVELEAAREAARGVGATFVLFGSFTHFGEGASLDLACASVPESAQSPREIFVQSGTLGEIIPRLDELAQKVANYLKDPAGPAPVSAPPPGLESPDLLDALSELDSLRARINALESEVFEPNTPAPAEELPLQDGFGSLDATVDDPQEE